MRPPRCARAGCRKKRPKVAIDWSDPYCSAICCRLDHGLDVPVEGSGGVHRSGTCRGCGCPHGEYSAQCDVCYSRRYSRERAAGRRAA